MLIGPRACLVLGVAAAAMLVAGVPSAVFALDRELSAEHLAFTCGFLIPLYATGCFAFWRRPDLGVARLLLAASSAWVLFSGGDLLLRALLDQGHENGLWAADLTLIGVGCAAFVFTLGLLGLFPDGRYHRRYERHVVRAATAVAVVVPGLAAITSPDLHVAFDSAAPSVSNPIAISPLDGLEELPEVLFSLLATLFAPTGLALLALRYRKLGPEQRSQVRWLLWVSLVGAMVAAGLALLADRAGGAVDTVAVVAGYAFLALVPIAIVTAILRYRLLDVDVLIRKSIVYGSLWLLIVIAYVAAAAALGIAAGDQLPVTLAILLTVVATLVFQPARQRLEQVADRWVFGERTSRYELLADFGAKLERTLSLDELLPRLAETAQRGLGASWARIALHLGSGENTVRAPRAAVGIDLHAEAEPSLSSPLQVAGAKEPVGVIECGPRLQGDYSDQDRSLLETLARQAALAVNNAALASELSARIDEIRIQADELAASRARIVHAQESERRRIERNIHDGVQQELVALIASLRLARNQLGRDPDGASVTLAELQNEASVALDDLRNLAQGIHPAVLTDKGLLPAIAARVRSAPVAITVSADPASRQLRFDDDVEGAAYFLTCEALANALKHARADSIEIRVGHDHGWLRVEVRDQGAGFAPLDTPRRGLANLEDRIAALGGRLTIDSEPGRGTTVLCELRAQAKEAAGV